MVSTFALLQEGSGAFLCFHLLPVPGWVFPGFWLPLKVQRCLILVTFSDSKL